MVSGEETFRYIFTSVRRSGYSGDSGQQTGPVIRSVDLNFL